MQQLKLLAAGLLTALFLFPAFCQAQAISIYSGNGQLVCPNCPLNPQKYAPLQVMVTGATGAPVMGTTVTWTTTQAGDQPVVATSVTNSAGVASYQFVPLALTTVENFYLSTVVASALTPAVNATFYETTALPGGAGTAAATINLVPASSPPVLTGIGGQTATAPIIVSVGSASGPLGNIQVTLQSVTTGLIISCQTEPGQQPGTVLTLSNGTATCYPQFGNTLGTGEYEIWVGVSYASFAATKFTITSGPPAAIKIINGNNQTVNAGTRAPGTLIAEVTDAGGNASVNVPVTWSVVPAGNATLSNIVSATLYNGEVSAWVTPTAGPVQVVVAVTAIPSVKATFTITVNTAVTAMQIVSGNNQSALEGAAFTEPLTVQVNDNAAVVPGAAVTFAVTSGPATVSASGGAAGASATATTGANGQASVTATAGATAGAVVITASVKSGTNTYSQTFSLTVNPPGPTVTSIVNAAGYQSQFVSPCSLAIISGTGLAPGLQGVVSTLTAPQTQVANATVKFGGVLAPILWVASVNGQESMAVQVPCEVPSSSATPPATVPMVVTANGVASAQPFAVTVLPLSPGIFQFTDTDGAKRAVLVRQVDGTFVSVKNPAHPGDILRMFVTGLGQTTPPLLTNMLDPLTLVGTAWVPAYLQVNADMVVGVNNGGVNVISAGYAYDMVGVYEVVFQVPEDAALSNNAPFAIAMRVGSNLLFGNPSLIPIQ